MKPVHLLSLAFAICSLGTSGRAAQDDQHPAHHPAGAASSPMPNAMPGKSGADMARMDTQTKAMRQMHDKVMAAKTPEERSALMAEHMKTMQDGMTMMNGAAPEGMSSMMGGMKGDMTMQHRMMEKRLEMMTASMQMMMDRLSAAPAK